MSGLFGLGGGFLITPLLAFVGVPPSIAVGTQANQLVGTSLAGTLAHWKRKNIDIRMGLVMLIGSFVGSTCGSKVFNLLQKIGHIDLIIKVCYVVMLGSMGIMVLIESVKRLSEKKAQKIEQKEIATKEESRQTTDHDYVRKWGADNFTAMDFPASRIRISALIPAGIGFVGGFLVSLLGIGGFFLIPAMIYIIRMPPRLVSGTTLFQFVFTTAFSTLLQAVLNHSVDILLALVLMGGGVIGAPFGAKLAVRINPVWARFFFAITILIVALRLLIDITITQDNPFTLETMPI